MIPKNVMARLKNAGINPLLPFANGGGSFTGGSVGSVSPSGGQGEAAQVDPELFPKVIGAFVDIAKKRADIDLIKAQTETERQNELLRSAQVTDLGFRTQHARNLRLGSSLPRNWRIVRPRKRSVRLKLIRLIPLIRMPGQRYFRMLHLRKWLMILRLLRSIVG